MRRLLAIILAALSGLQSCAQFSGNGPGNNLENNPELPPLPAVAALPCCWQAEQRVHITAEDSGYDVYTVTAREREKLTLVALDPLGRRMLTLVYEGAAVRTLDAPPDWDSRQNRYLLLAIFLHHAAPGPWIAGMPDWQVIGIGERKSLNYKDKEIAVLNYAASHGDGPRTRSVKFNGYPMSLSVVPVARSPL